MRGGCLHPRCPFPHAALHYGDSHGDSKIDEEEDDVDYGDDEESDDWQSAEVRTGTAHLAGAARRAHFPSPFDYAANTKILIVNDIGREDAEQVSAAFRELFKAAGGGKGA